MKFLLRLSALTVAAAALTCLSVVSSAAPAAPLQAKRHWDHMPIRVYFQSGGTSSPDRIFSAENGFLEWTTASRGALQYVVVNTASAADVVVRFVPTVPVAQGAARVGETETESDGALLRKATIRLTTVNADLSQLTEEAAHEWGHALGITDHSTDPNDLMYPTTVRVYDENTGEFQPTPARIVSAADLRAVAAVYARQFHTADSRR